jgi:hypothetical protein
MVDMKPGELSLEFAGGHIAVYTELRRSELSASRKQYHYDQLATRSSASRFGVVEDPDASL